MDLMSRSFRGPILLVLILFLLYSLVASHERQETQLRLADISEKNAERNATIAVYPMSNYCTSHPKYHDCDKYLSNTFSLAPEFCLSGLNPHNYLRVVEPPTCVSEAGEYPAVLFTYGEVKCMGISKIQYFPDGIEFPFTVIPGLGSCRSSSAATWAHSST
jgi:hypothetical protein